MAQRSELLVRALEKERVHRKDEIDLVAGPPPFLEEIARKLERRNRWTLVRQDDVLLLTTDAGTCEGRLERVRLDS